MHMSEARGIMTKEPTIRQLQLDLAAANREARGYLDQLAPLREENRKLTRVVELMRWQMDLIKQALRAEFKP